MVYWFPTITAPVDGQTKERAPALFTDMVPVYTLFSQVRLTGTGAVLGKPASLINPPVVPVVP